MRHDERLLPAARRGRSAIGQARSGAWAGVRLDSDYDGLLLARREAALTRAKAVLGLNAVRWAAADRFGDFRAGIQVYKSRLPQAVKAAVIIRGGSVKEGEHAVRAGGEAGQVNPVHQIG